MCSKDSLALGPTSLQSKVLALDPAIIASRWMEKEYGHHVAASLPAESDTGLSAKKIMEEGNLPTFTLQEVRFVHLHTPVMFIQSPCN